MLSQCPTSTIRETTEGTDACECCACRLIATFEQNWRAPAARPAASLILDIGLHRLHIRQSPLTGSRKLKASGTGSEWTVARH